MTYILKAELAAWKNPQMIWNSAVYTLRRANTAMFPYHYVQVLLISQIKTYEHCIFSLKIPFRHKFPRISSWWLCFSLYFWIIKEHNLTFIAQAFSRTRSADWHIIFCSKWSWYWIIKSNLCWIIKLNKSHE